MGKIKSIAMIPARLGSKRIPKKNIRLLDGKPLLQFAIELSLNSGCFDEVWVNSESDIIGKLAEKCGARFHKRPRELASDQSTNEDFLPEFLKKHDCDYLFMVNSTSPLLENSTLQKFYNYVVENKFDAVFSVENEFAECFFKNQPVNFSLDKKINSQDIIPVKKIVWAVTAWKKEFVIKNCTNGKYNVFSGDIGHFSIPKDQCCDLDTPEDWNIAEVFLANKKNRRDDIQYWLG